MQIRSTIAFYNHKVPIILKKKFTLRYGKSRENYQIFSRTYQQKSRTFKDFPGQQKKSRTFQDFSRMWQPCHSPVSP